MRPEPRPRGRQRRCTNCGRQVELLGGRWLICDSIEIRAVVDAGGADDRWTGIAHDATRCSGLRISGPAVQG